MQVIRGDCDRPQQQAEARDWRADLVAWQAKWQASQPKLCDRVEETIEVAFAFLRLPRQHHLRMQSTNMLERLNGETKRRTAGVA